MLKQLIRKELHLQKSNGWFALVVLLFWVALIVAAPFGEQEIASMGRAPLRDVLLFLQATFVFTCLAFVLPMAIGATLAAEERNADVWDWTLSLPGSRKTQWLVKVAAGMFLTAVLVWVALPLMNAALIAALPLRDGVTETEGLGSQQLPTGTASLFLPLVFFASGAFASSLLSRPYKAFFLAIPIAGLSIMAARLTDVGGLLGIPWSGEDLAQQGLNGMARFYAILHYTVAAGLLLWLAGLNFRFDHFRKRRLALELAVLVAATAIPTGILLHLAIDPAPLVSGRWDDAATRIEQNRKEGWDNNLPRFDRKGITPLIVARRNPPWWTGSARLPNDLDCRIAERPDTADPNTEYVTLHSMSFAQRRTIRLDVRTGDIKTYATLRGILLDMLSATLPFALPRVRMTPVPLLNTILLFRESRRIYDRASVQHYETCIVSDRNGRSLKVHGIMRLSDSLPYYAGYLKDETESDESRWGEPVDGYALLRREADKWELVEHGRHHPCAISPDGKWLTRGSVGTGTGSWLAASRRGLPVLHVVSLDGTTTLTVRGGERMRFSTRWPWSARVLQAYAWPKGMTMGPWIPGVRPPHPRAYENRFVLFQRIHTIGAPDETGAISDTSIPKSLDIGVLDLETGAQNVVLRLKPESKHVRGYYESLESEPRVVVSPGGKPQPFLSEIHDFAQVRLAPKRPRWAVYYDGWLTILDAVADGAPNGKTTFREKQRIDLRGIFPPDEQRVKQFRFVNDATLLVWDAPGIFRIDLPETTTRQMRDQ